MHRLSLRAPNAALPRLGLAIQTSILRSSWSPLSPLPAALHLGASSGYLMITTTTSSAGGRGGSIPRPVPLASNREQLLQAARDDKVDLLRSLSDTALRPGILAQTGTSLSELLVAATERSNIGTMAFLLRHGAPIDDAVREASATREHQLSLPVYQLLISHGLPIDGFYDETGYGMHTCILTHALWEEKWELFDYLLAIGADPNGEDYWGVWETWTPLHAALLRADDIEVIKKLVQYGADWRDGGLLCLAAWRGWHEAIAYLLDLPSSIEGETFQFGVNAVQNMNGALHGVKGTALYAAALGGHLETCKLLIDRYAADPDIKDEDGQTVTERAANATVLWEEGKKRWLSGSGAPEKHQVEEIAAYLRSVSQTRNP